MIVPFWNILYLLFQILCTFQPQVVVVFFNIVIILTALFLVVVAYNNITLYKKNFPLSRGGHIQVQEIILILFLFYFSYHIGITKKCIPFSLYEGIDCYRRLLLICFKVINCIRWIFSEVVNQIHECKRK